MLKTTNKLLLILASFICARVLMILACTYIKGAAASFISCILYLLLFYLFYLREQTEKRPLGVVKSFITLALFLFVSCTVSTLLSIVFDTETVRVSLLQGALSVFFVPIAEELFFRATLFKSLDKLISTPAAVLLSSLIFSLSHTGTASVIASFIMGAILACIYKKTGSIKLPTVCHAANNFLALVLSF